MAPDQDQDHDTFPLQPPAPILPLQLSQIFVPLAIAAGQKKEKRNPFTFTSTNGETIDLNPDLFRRVWEKVRAVPSDVLGPREEAALESYCGRLSKMERNSDLIPGGTTSLGSHVTPLLDILNSWLEKLGSRAFYSNAIIKGRPCLVARGSDGTDIIDLVTVELQLPKETNVSADSVLIVPCKPVAFLTHLTSSLAESSFSDPISILHCTNRTCRHLDERYFDNRKL